jgi:hypothetical protein
VHQHSANINEKERFTPRGDWVIGRGVRLSIERIPDDRAGHAVAAASAAAEPAAGDRDDFDAGLAQPQIGMRVPVVREDCARLDRDD